MFSTPPGWRREIRLPERTVEVAFGSLARVAGATALLVATTLVLGRVVPGTSHRDPLLAPMERLQLGATESLLACGVVAIAHAAGALLLAGLRKARCSQSLERAGRSALSATSVVLLALYLSSWGLFWGTGTFLDADVIRFALGSPGQMGRHLLSMNPLLTVGFPFAVAGAILALRAVRRRLARTHAAQRVMASALVVSVVAWAGLAAAGEVTSARRHEQLVDSAGFRVTAGWFWRDARDARTGPILHLLSAARSREPAIIGSRLNLPDAGPALGLTLEPRPLLTPEAWATTVEARPTTSVIVVLVESLRLDALRAFGGRREVMPALDAFAEGAIRFQRAYAQASHSDYADLCPLGSQYPLRELRHHHYPSPLPYPRALLYDLLKPLGYRTAIVSSQNETWGQMHNYLASDALDHFFDSRRRPHDATVDEEDLVFARWATELELAGKLDDRITIDEAIRWIDESAAPFFMYVNLQNSHFPYRIPAEFSPPFAPHHVDFPYTFANYPADKVDVVRNRYDNSLAYVDAQLARLLAHLARTGRLDRTIVVVTGDTGQAFMEHGVSGHAGPLFEEVVRVPLIVRAPGVAGSDVHALTEHVDVPPTILALLGLPPFPGFQGRSLTSPGDGDTYLVVQTPRAHQVAVVSGRHKLIYDIARDQYLLFDVVGDPGERENLVDDEPALRAALAGRLQAWVDAQLGYYARDGARDGLFPPVVVPVRAYESREDAPLKAPLAAPTRVGGSLTTAPGAFPHARSSSNGEMARTGWSSPAGVSRSPSTARAARAASAALSAGVP